MSVGETLLQAQATAFYIKAWGKEWPREERLLDVDDIATLGSDESDDFVATRVSSSQKYICLVGMAEVMNTLGAGTINGDTLLVRQEYESLINRITTGSYEKKDVVVTGQPGIGKTMFLYYLLLYRLERKFPTAIQLSAQRYFLFDEQGAMVFSPAVDDGYSRLKRCWALTDSNAKVIQPCDLFLDAAPHIIQTTAPKRECFKEWAKQRSGRVVVMDLPTMEEIALIVKERGYEPSLCFPFVEKWGPSIRIILKVMESVQYGKVASYEETLTGSAIEAARKICNNSALFRCTNLDSQNALESLFFNLVFVRPRRSQFNGVTEWEHWYRWIPTQHLADIFRTQQVNLSPRDALRLFEVLSRHSLTKSPAGWDHELKMHRRLCLTGTGPSIFREGSRRSIPLSPNLIPGTLSGLKSTGKSEDFYWLPTTTTFPGVDGVLGAGGEIYAVQATIGNDHQSPLLGLEKLWMNLSPTVRWGQQLNVVFIADTMKLAAELMQKYTHELRSTTFGRKKKSVVVWGSHLG